MSRLVSNVLRLATVDKVDYSSGVVYTKWMDQAGEDGPIVAIPHPFPGQKGEGIYSGIRKGNIIALAMLSNERYIPVSLVAIPGAYDDLLSVSEASFDDIGFPYLNAGDVVIQGATGGQLRYNCDGDILISTAFGEGIIYGGDTDESVRCSIETPSPLAYSVSHAGVKATGLVRRDMRVEEGESDYADYLISLDAEKTLEEVGWDVTKRVAYVSRTPTTKGNAATNDKHFKNPAFVEDRQLLYEFGKDWYVKDFLTELKRLEDAEVSLNNPTDRGARRSNVLSLSQTNPNELIEKVSGTLVDIFGNLLTINKIMLPTPQGTKANDLLKEIFEINRHTVAFHMEINTKKGYGYREGKATTKKPIFLEGFPNPMISANNARDRSRWALRVDKEGLTTVNIPATSETGNIPLLTRQETSSTLSVDDKGAVHKGQRSDPDGLYRNSKNQDIFHDQFGPGGIKLSDSSVNKIENRLQGNKTSWKDKTDSQYSLPKYIEAGTAFHDITQTAMSLLKNTINITASDIFDESSTIEADPPAITNEVDASVPKAESSNAQRNPKTGLVEGQPNAGGRSAQINLDGSLEMSIGANTIDRVSWVLDTAGAIITRLGRDRKGRSAVIQADGTVAIEIGGFDFVGEGANDTVDTRFVGRGDSRTTSLPGDPKRYKSGKMVIKLMRANPSGTGPDEDDSFLILDDTGVTLVTAGRLNLISKLDMTLKSESRILFDAPVVQNYIDNPKFIVRDGRIM
ncbi:MAG: hypothetical protein WC516_08190 [Patescibacteria group bacterium]|jgi:hypothetical protein